MKRLCVLMQSFYFTMLLGVTIFTSSAFCMPLVSYTVAGSENNWTLDFTVKNMLSGDNIIYFFGVDFFGVDSSSIVGSPGAWIPYYWDVWSNSGFGGSSIEYYINWYDFYLESETIIQSGNSLSGFKVQLTTPSAPTAVNWFAWASYGIYDGNILTGWNGEYDGSDQFNTFKPNPGFEGVAFNADAPPTVPEPSTALLLGLGLLGAAIVGRRKVHR